MSLQISILTPEKPFWNGQAEEIILPTETGEMGVLKNHAPIITGLDVGAMLVRTKEEWNSYALMGGFALVKQNEAINYTMGDDRKTEITFKETPNGVEIIESFDPESENPEEMQKGG